MNHVRFILCLIALVCLGETVNAQPPAPQYAYRVSFTNKNGGTASISDPLSYLSPRAIARRNNLGIAIDTTDLPVSPAYIDSVLTLTGGELHVVSKWLNDCVVLVTDSTNINAIRGKSFIKDIAYIAYYPSGLHKPAGISNSKFSNELLSVMPAHPSVAKKMTGTALFYGQTYSQTVLVNGDFLHDAGYKGSGMLIAVLDAGFRGTDTQVGFDSLRDGGILDVHNFVMDNDDVYNYDTHGTEALSTIAGYVPKTFVGTAPRAHFVLYITEDNNSEQPIEMDNMLAATERADSMGVDVISVSLGYDVFDNSTLTYADIDGKTTVAAKAANMATKKGMLFVPSAGNDGGTSWHYVLTPGDADSALTVGAVFESKTAVSFSGYGPNSAGRIKPDVCDLGYQVNVISSTGYGAQDGTSFATPMIAGWAACLWEANRKATPSMIRNAIIQSADHYTTPDSQLGYGVPDFEKASEYLHVEDTISFDTTKWVAAGPNPFTGQIKVIMHLNSIQEAYFQLYDMYGRKVFSHTQTIDTWNDPVVILNTPTSLSRGIYILKVLAGDNKGVMKLVKQ